MTNGASLSNHDTTSAGAEILVWVGARNRQNTAPNHDTTSAGAEILVLIGARNRQNTSLGLCAFATAASLQTPICSLSCGF